MLCNFGKWCKFRHNFGIVMGKWLRDDLEKIKCCKSVSVWECFLKKIDWWFLRTFENLMKKWIIMFESKPRFLQLSQLKYMTFIWFLDSYHALFDLITQFEFF